jgi:hypothetical protein
MRDLAANQLRAEIARRKKALALAPFGIGEVLDLVDAWVASVETRMATAIALTLTEDEIARRQGRRCPECDT